MTRILSRKRSERGVALVLTTAAIVMIVPLMSLIVDVGVLYVAKSRLQSAVDGSALAAARALNLGQTTAAQATSAQRNAVNWFYANFPNGNWSTTGTVMNTGNVSVYDDSANPNLRHVDLFARTNVPTYFMKWFNRGATTIQATGHATRRDAIIMIVLDRSGSMCQPSGTTPCGGSGQPAEACKPMKDAAKLFTGQFAVGRDYIGLVSFSDGTFVHSSPTRNFRTKLGYYVSGTDNGTGDIDTIECTGRTNSAAAISLAYNELYKMNLPGALNVILFESDGLPNTLTMNMWDAATSTFAFKNVGTSSVPLGCQDGQSKTKIKGGWANGTTGYNNRAIWVPAYTMSGTNPGFMSDIPSGAIMGVFSEDPSRAPGYEIGYSPYQPNGKTGIKFLDTDADTNRDPTGCRFISSRSNIDDLSWLPATDVFGNSVNPTNAYLTGVNMSSGRLVFDNTQQNSANWNNFHKAAYNATDNAAYRARTNSSIQATMFVIGLGGQGNDPPDYTLMQRLANDPLGDQYNSPVRYYPCSATPNCVNYPSQPQGQFVFSSNSTKLKQAFLALSSQILRLSQ